MITPDEAAARTTTGAHGRHGQVLLPLTRLTEEHVGQDIEITDLWGSDNVVYVGRLAAVPVFFVSYALVSFESFDGVRELPFRLNETRFVIAPPRPAPAVDEKFSAFEGDDSDDVTVTLARDIKAVTEDIVELDARLAALKEHRAYLENQLIERFASQGVSSVNVDGHSVHLHRRRYADFLDRPAELGGGKWSSRELVPFFRAMNRSELITPETMHAGRLVSVIKEYLADGGNLPPELADKVKLETATSIRVGAARKRS